MPIAGQHLQLLDNIPSSKLKGKPVVSRPYSLTSTDCILQLRTWLHLLSLLPHAMPYLRRDGYESSSPSSQSDDWPLNEFQKLVNELSDVLGPSSGLDSDDVDPNNIIRIMEKYTSDSSEWGQYALADASRAYTRNLVDEGNGKSNLVCLRLEIRSLTGTMRFLIANSLQFPQLILVWNPGKGSAIHDHADAHCVMKVRPLRHTLIE